MTCTYVRTCMDRTVSWLLFEELNAIFSFDVCGRANGTKEASWFISNLLWANSFQVMLAFLDFLYNALLWCQLVVNEWSGYAIERKTLRVTHPKVYPTTKLR